MADEELEVEAGEGVEDVPSARDLIEEQFDAAEEAEAATGEAPEGAEESIPAAAQEGRERDEHGRFKSKAAEEAGEAVQPEAVVEPAAAGDGGQPAAVVEPAVEDRPPQSWKADAREHWGKLPAEVKAEVQRREADVQNVFERTVNERKLAQAFHQVYQPYEAMIRGEGSDPLKAVETLFQTAYQLRTAQPLAKAQLVASLISQYGVDVQTLDSVLSRTPPPQHIQPASQQAPKDPRVDQLMIALQNQQRDGVQRREGAALAEVDKFGTTHEFLNDVRDSMADLIEVADRRGIDLSMEDAYNQACRLHPEIAKVVDQRARAKAAGEAQQRGIRTRRAASSVSGAPAGAPPKTTGPVSRREALEDAIEQHAD